MTPTDQPVYTMPTVYTVFALPPDHREASNFHLTVEWRGRYDGADRWAVCTRFGECLGVDGQWTHERQPSSRTDEWLAAHRFDLDTALRLAQEAAPQITVNGYTVADVLPWGPR